MNVLRFAAIAILATLATTVNAAVITWDGGAFTNNWHDDQNWDLNRDPTAADRVVIPSNGFARIYAADAEADTLEIYGKIRIDSGRTLVLDNDNNNTGGGPPDHSVLDGGILTLGEPIAGIGIVRFVDSDHILDDGVGEGVVLMRGGRFEIAADITFTNELEGVPQDFTDAITGYGEIVGLESASKPATYGIFVNSGLVNADGGTLVIAQNTVFSDTEDANWSATACNGGSLEFQAGSTVLVGDFESGTTTTMSFYANVKTCGALRRDGGAFFVATGVTFKYVGFSATGGCTNPGTIACAHCPVNCTTNIWFLPNGTYSDCGTCGSE